MAMKAMRVPIVLLLSMVLTACGGRREVYDAPLEVIGPFPIPFGLAYLNRTSSELIRVRQTNAGLSAGQVRPAVDRVRLGAPGARLVQEVAVGQWLAILHSDPTRPGLSLVAPTGNQVEFHPLADAFDTLAVAPSSRYGVAYFSDPGAALAGIRNLNQIQVIDFVDRTVQAARALETGGLSPLGVDFVPLGSGAFDDVAAVRVENGVVLVDLAEVGSEPLWVRFTNSPGGVAVPAEVVFGPFFPDGGTFYVRLQGSDDVLSVHLTRDEQGRLRRSINFLNTPDGSRPTDLLVLKAADFSDKVVVVFSGSEHRGVALLDANSIQTDERTFPLDFTASQARRLVVWESTGQRELVLVTSPSPSGPSPRAVVIDPASGQTETVYLQDEFYRVDGPPDGSTVMFFHHRMGQTSSPGMRVVRLIRPEGSSRWTHRISTFGLQSEPRAWAFDGDGQGMLGSFQAGNNSFLLDLASGQYASLALDRAPLAMGTLPGTDLAWFQHAHPLGSLSLVPLGDFQRAATVMVEGFVLQGLLDP
jgi:DNA-binding beta-propeller fold protein YncE